MTVMATGLMADVAWAQANHDQVPGAITTLKKALARIESYSLERSELEHCARHLVGGVIGNIDQWLSASDETGRKKSRFRLEFVADSNRYRPCSSVSRIRSRSTGTIWRYWRCDTPTSVRSRRRSTDGRRTGGW